MLRMDLEVRQLPRPHPTRNCRGNVLDDKDVWHHIGAMQSDQLTAAVRNALRKAPCSLRALAKEAGVPHSTLVRIQGGTRAATPEVAAAVTMGLQAWAKRCGQLATSVAKAQKKEARNA